VIYAVAVNLIFLLAMIPDIRTMADRRRRGVAGDFSAAMEYTPMGRGIKRMAQRVGLLRDKP